MKTNVWSFCNAALFTVVFLCGELAHSQIERWTYIYAGYSNESTFDLVVGLDDNVYVVGGSWQSSSASFDVIVISISPTGSERWVYTYDWYGGTDVGYTIACDSSGNIYVAGLCDSLGTQRGLVISLDSTGGERWIYRGDCVGSPTYGGTNNLIYGSDGNIYGVGSGVWSMDSLGNEKWICYDDTSFHAMGGIAYGSDGNIYVGGYRQRYGVSYDFAILSLTAGGVKRWVYAYDDVIGDYHTMAVCLCYGTDGNIYAGGNRELNYSTTELVVASVTTAGDERWVYTYGTTVNTSNMAYDVTYGTDDNVYVCGEIDKPYFGIPVCAVMSFTPMGDHRWFYSDTGGVSYSLVFGLDSNIYAVGEMGFSIFPRRYSALNLTTLGNINWTYEYLQSGWSGVIKYVVYGADDYLYLAGDVEMLVISLDPTTGVTESMLRKNVDFIPLLCVQNPCRNEISIEYMLPATGHAEISIFNNLGERVRTLLCGEICAGRYSLIWNSRDDCGERVPSGVYFVKYIEGNCCTTKKLVLLQ